jgi:hypothetical protein
MKSHTTTLTPEELAKLMSQKDFASISDPHKRKLAVIDHLVRIMTDHMHDRELAAKILTQQPKGTSSVISLPPEHLLK